MIRRALTRFPICLSISLGDFFCNNRSCLGPDFPIYAILITFGSIETIFNHRLRYGWEISVSACTFNYATEAFDFINNLSSDSVASQRMAMSFAIEFHGGLVNGGIEAFRPCEGLMSEMMLL